MSGGRSLAAARATAGWLWLACVVAGAVCVLLWVDVWDARLIGCAALLAAASYAFGLLWFMAALVEDDGWPGGPGGSRVA